METLGEHRRRIEQLEAALDAGDAGFLARWIAEAVGQPPADARRGVRRPRRAAAAARPRSRPPRRARGDHAGARRRADQHRGLRAPAPLARARGRADAARRGSRSLRGARPSCSRRRATASSSRRVVRVKSRARPARSSATPSCPATSRSRIAPSCSARSPTGRREIAGFGRSGDTESTLARRARARRRGRGARRRRGSSSRVAACAACAHPTEPIDCGNAGTLMRLLAGLLAGQEGRFELGGDDESLSRRPMERVAAPLRELGARVETTDGHAPLDDRGRRRCAGSATSCRSRARR